MANVRQKTKNAKKPNVSLGQSRSEIASTNEIMAASIMQTAINHMARRVS